MVTNGPDTAPAKRLWHILLAMYYLLSKGISKHNWLSLDLHLLFKRGRLAAKSLRRLTHPSPSSPFGPTKSYLSALSCRSMDPATAVYVPREVEFSCSNTPSFPYFQNSKQKLFRLTHKQDMYSYNREVASTVTKIYQVLDMEESEDESSINSVATASPSPSPWISWKTPVGLRQLRVSDSPFSMEEGEERDDGGGVDMKAEEFITRFREQLRSQLE